jgi:hypothetical protein
MRFISNRDSSRLGEPSVLSIIETLLAMSISVGAGIYFDTWWHVFIGACMAPFMLLRTERSYEEAIGLWHLIYAATEAATSGTKNLLAWSGKEHPRTWRVIDRLPGWLVYGVVLGITFIILPVAEFLIFVGGTFACALIATVYVALVAPITTLAAVPSNWWRVVVATDTATSPDIIPVPAWAASGPGPTDVYTLLQKRYLPASFAGKLAVIWLRAWATLLILAVSFGYRFSVKSTAIVWFPLLWALRPSKPPDRSWEAYLAVECDLRKPQLVAVWSGACLALLAMKYALWAFRYQMVTSLEALTSRLDAWGLGDAPGAVEWAAAVIRPGAIPLWQVATLINSILGIVFWWRVRTWLAEFHHAVGPPDATIDRTINSTFFFRRLLTSYTVLCNGYIVYKVAEKLPVPEIGWKLVPWV